MKKYKRIVLIILGSLLSACLSFGNSIVISDYDYLIFSDRHAYFFKQNAQHFEKIDAKEIAHKDVYFWGNNFEQVSNQLITKTRERISKFVSFDLDKQVLHQNRDNNVEYFHSRVAENGIYSAGITGQEITFEKRALDLTVEKTRKVATATMTLVNKLIVDDERLYALVAEITNGDSSQNYIWVMDVDFNRLDTIALNNQGSHYLDMVKVADNFYLTASKEGRLTNGEPGPGNHILKFNSRTGGREKITVSDYPKNIFYDDANQKLIVSHDELYTADFLHTVIDIADDTLELVRFPELMNARETVTLAPVVQVHDKGYDFLFQDRLVTYDTVTKQQHSIDLKEHGITKATAMFRK